MADVPRLEFAEFDESPDDEQPSDIAQCDDCKNHIISGRTFLLGIDGGLAAIACPNDGCDAGPDIDPDMLQMPDIKVTLALRFEGGTFEHPQDGDYYFDITAVQ
jgi:hypothetical protein